MEIHTHTKTHPDTEMWILTAGKTHRSSYVENELGVLRVLGILEYLAVFREGGEVLKIRDVPGVQEHAVDKLRKRAKLNS